MLDVYQEYVQQYKQKYGDRTIVLCQVGSFYELYDDGTNDLVDLKNVCEILQIQITRRNKAILEVSRSNHLMAGFPEYALSKFTNLLVDNNYTVVVVSQVSPPPRPKRAVTQIVSPGTRLEGAITQQVDSNMLMSIIINNIDYGTIVAGVSVIDITTGESKAIEINPKNQDSSYVLDELLRYICVFNPSEIIINGEINPVSWKSIEVHLDLQSRYVHNYVSDKPTCDNSIAYQNHFLGKVYSYGLLTPIEYLNMENMPFARRSFIELLKFAHQHNENTINKLSKPDVSVSNQNFNVLHIPDNSIRQLNLNDLIKIINTCTTSIGKRYFKHRILNPMTSLEDITSSYNAIEKISPEAQRIQRTLRGVYDLHRLFRRVHLGMLHPADWNLIEQSFLCLETCPDCPDITELRNSYKAVLNMDEIGKYHIDNITDSFFNEKLYPDIDQLKYSIDSNIELFKSLANDLNSLASATDFFKVDYNDRDGYFITATAKRWKSLSEANSLSGLTAKPLSASSSVVRINRQDFNEINDVIRTSRTKLSVLVLDAYKSFLKQVSDKYSDLLSDVVRYTAKVDFDSACACNAEKWRYVRPFVVDDARSWLRCEQLRHPVVERIQNHIEYIANDVVLDGKGVLLYGINSAGKSTLMKATGICVIMAQAGMFVPCSTMTFSPFKQIFTRIPSGDDLMKGQSTFTVEVGEIRNILKRADSNSLVIGDELCSGTESVSAQSIVSAGIIELNKKNCAFIFASHLHDLIKISRIKKLIESNALDVYHLGVRYDEGSKKLIYDRKLQPGQGTTLYGLEVCKSLDMGVEFINLANEIRQEVINVTSIVPKKSRYNAKKYLDKTCAICKRNKTTEVHHIKQQREADANGFIAHMHKNVVYNLVETCSECHDRIHAGDIHVEGYRQTSSGIELVTNI